MYAYNYTGMHADCLMYIVLPVSLSGGASGEFSYDAANLSKQLLVDSQVGK